MNPHAKEFVPAHIMKQRQEEGEELANKVGQVDLDDSKAKSDDATTSRAAGDSTTNDLAKDNGTLKSNDADQSTGSQHNQSDDAQITPTPNQQSDKMQQQRPHHNQNHNHHHYNHHSQHSNTNGDKRDSGGETDHHLLKAGETYCEFNGEQFIIPGEGDEYEPDYQPYGRKAGYDFGNAEDNEDEDVCNAYEQFLDNLPE